ncbi:MAG: toprim domain-containing protein [Spirochaetales bacterium]|nr:toprim domain-containing protein [Spirochaetales bacterium]
MKKDAFFVSPEEKRSARRVDLYTHVTTKYGDQFIPEGRDCVRMKSNRSVCIKRGISGFHDFATGEHGNSIDFMMRYMGCSFVDAVRELLQGEADVVRNQETQEGQAAAEPPSFTLPVATERPFTQVHTYLIERGLPKVVINHLFERELLYQDQAYGNCVFVTPQKDYYELRGTLSSEFSFHGCKGMKPNRFWYLTDEVSPVIAFVCEGAIDAVSLYTLYKRSKQEAPAVFISIGGVAKQSTIDRIKTRIPAVLAVDNDEAGHACREKNLDIPCIFPRHKDWNEDLQNGVRTKISIPYPYQTRFIDT